MRRETGERFFFHEVAFDFTWGHPGLCSTNHGPHHARALKKLSRQPVRFGISLCGGRTKKRGAVFSP
ncbi:MAG: hypothetical protein V3T61_03580, partial [Acidobacteriota bacterium]